jgi:tetratricopeptide (TPR) repeat protein
MPERIELLTQAIQLNATNFNFYHYRAIAYYEQLDYENTINDCKMCLQFVTFIPSLDLMANTFLVQGNFEEAEINYKKILDLSPNYYNSLLGLGMICQDKNNIEGAVDYFTKAVDTNPEISEAWNFRANAKRLQGKLNEALPDVYKSLELNPNNGVALATLAEINAAKGMVNEFYLNFEMALKIDAEKLQKFLFKDPVYQQFKNEERFIKILERYSIVFPD